MASNKTNLRNTQLLEAFQKEQMKVYVDTINPGTDNRPKFLYEAHADTEDGQACIQTCYVYVGTSSTVLYTVEKKSTWQGSWDTAAEVAAQLLGYSIEG